VQFSGWEHQQQFFSHGLRAATFGAIKFTGSKRSELLRHAGNVKLCREIFNPEGENELKGEIFAR
jgi:hypothetical protein